MNRTEKHRLRYLTATITRHREHGTLWRPDGAVIVNVTVRFLRDLALDRDAPFDKMLTAISKQAGVDVDELKYLSDIGEWVLLDRGMRELDEDDYTEFWEGDNAIDLRSKMLTAPFEKSRVADRMNKMWNIS